jgi:hypothetical protein
MHNYFVMGEDAMRHRGGKMLMLKHVVTVKDIRKKGAEHPLPF